MKCLTANWLTIDNCLEMWRQRRVDCSTPYRFVIEQFDWFDTLYKFDLTARKGDGNIIGDVEVDNKSIRLQFTLTADSKGEYFDGLQVVRRTLQPSKTYPTNAFRKSDQGYKPISRCDPNGQEWSSKAKIYSMTTLSESNDGCSGTFEVLFYLGSNNCTFEGCWFGKSQMFEGLLNATSGISPFPPELGDETYINLVRSNRQNLCETGMSSLPFFDNYYGIQYDGPSCCKVAWSIIVTQEITGPIELYVMGGDCSFQGIKLNVASVPVGAQILFDGTTGDVVITDPLSPIPIVDVYNDLEGAWCEIPIICPHKDIGDVVGLPSNINNIIAFRFHEGMGELSFTCTNTRC